MIVTFHKGQTSLSYIQVMQFYHLQVAYAVTIESVVVNS